MSIGTHRARRFVALIALAAAVLPATPPASAPGVHVVTADDIGYGQVGDGTTARRLIPTPGSGLTGAVSVAAGDRHTCAPTAAGAVMCWGANSSGEVGDGTLARRTCPCRSPGPAGRAPSPPGAPRRARWWPAAR